MQSLKVKVAFVKQLPVMVILLAPSVVYCKLEP